MGARGMLLVVLVAGVPVSAAAQSDAELERAREAFAAGVEATDEGRWDDAVASFREVMGVRATPQVKYNLAVALEQTGEYVETEQLLEEVVDGPELDRRTRREAEQLLEEVGPRAEEQRAEREAAAAAAAPTPEETAQTSVLDEELFSDADEEEQADEGGPIFGEWWFWTGVGAVVVGAVLVGVLVASSGDEDPVRGNLSPGVLRVGQ